MYLNITILQNTLFFVSEYFDFLEYHHDTYIPDKLFFQTLVILTYFPKNKMYLLP